ncbi:MAG: hypothetical protein ACK5JO_00295 [Halodesulfovibrio sp.]
MREEAGHVDCERSNDSAAERELYLKIRESYVQLANSQSNSFDGKIFTIAAISLAFSVSFVKDVAKGEIDGPPWLLFCTWGMLILSCLLTLCSFKSAEWCCNDYCESLDNSYAETGIVDPRISSRWENITIFLNGFSLFFCICGMTTLLVYLYLSVFL